ncbi:solute carrier family 17 member 9 [Delphinapterus leucas]|uniref:Solute carrier family 17 member 9 n=1 Tax=Delphinapterus leucas TaxID=9749 RepID=A0A7F8KER1_DELLE|nr:solute carrier family 17 member 9 [Delphinapterus leucas]
METESLRPGEQHLPSCGYSASALRQPSGRSHPCCVRDPLHHFLCLPVSPRSHQTPECQVWTGTLLLGTCLLYCARVSVPVCAAAMSQDFGWNKKEGLLVRPAAQPHSSPSLPSRPPCRIGGEKVILLSASAWGFITAATPLLSRLSSAHLAFMTFSRILTGLLQGVYFPALTSLLSQKVRESERAFTYSTVGAGSQFGTLVTGAVGSLLLDWYGWPSVFYFSGGLTLLWVCYVYRRLLGEKDLILALGVLAQGLPVSRHTKVPWRQLFRKPSVWAAIISQLSAACSFFILLSWLPTFFKETFPSSKGWVFNVVPWLVAIPASLFSGLLSDRLINQGYRTITVRKFMQAMGLGLSSIFALCLGHTSSFCKSVVFASASIGLQTFNHSGISVNIQDLAPSCAGFLFGVANTAGALASEKWAGVPCLRVSNPEFPGAPPHACVLPPAPLLRPSGWGVAPLGGSPQCQSSGGGGSSPDPRAGRGRAQSRLTRCSCFQWHVTVPSHVTRRCESIPEVQGPQRPSAWVTVTGLMPSGPPRPQLLSKLSSKGRDGPSPRLLVPSRGCRSRGRVPGWLPHRDHGLLDVCVQPGGSHQQPRAMHLPGVREGPAGGPEPRP